MNQEAFKESADGLISLVERKDAEVKRWALEGLLTIARSNCDMIESIDQAVKVAFAELNIRNEFITEIALPDNSIQKIDAGMPIRRAAYNLLTKFIEVGVAPKDAVLKLVDFIAKAGLNEANDDIFKLCLTVISSLARKAGHTVVSKLDILVAVME